MKTTREELLDAAQSLPIAQKSDFIDWSCFNEDGVEPDSFRVITDTQLRSRLINAGIAAGVQSPKGKQDIPSIIRLFPLTALPNRTPRRAKQQLPTISDLEALTVRVRTEEAKAAREMQQSNEKTIHELKDKLAEASLHEAEQIHAELGKAFEERGNVERLAYLEALRRVGDDAEFPQRVFLSLVAA